MIIKFPTKAQLMRKEHSLVYTINGKKWAKEFWVDEGQDPEEILDAIKKTGVMRKTGRILEKD